MLTIQELQDGLAQHYGTEGYHRLTLMPLRCTDGVKFLAQGAECFWLIEAIASHQPKAMRDPMLRDFQFWVLKRNEGDSFSLICYRDTDDEAFRQEFEFTTFPLDEFKLYLENGVLMLPSER